MRYFKEELLFQLKFFYIFNKTSRQVMLTVEKRKIANLGHVLRHDRCRLLQLIMMEKVEGKRYARRRKNWLLFVVVVQLFLLSMDSNKVAILTNLQMWRGTLKKDVFLCYSKCYLINSY